MFTPIIRLILVIANLSLAAYFYSEGAYTNMSLMLLSAGFFIYGYFKYGTVYAAFQQLKKGNITKTEALISKIKNPDKLGKSHKS